LQSITDTDLSNQAFPFLTAQEIDIGYARVLAKRQTFIGELGWELQIPSEFVQDVYDILIEAGKPLGLKPAGYHALEHLRCERAYREFVLDLAPDDTPFEAGLGFIVKMDKTGGFHGREALLPQAGKVLGRRMVMFKLKDPEPALFHDELIRMNGEIVGYLSSGAYGFTLGSAVGMGYVKHSDGVTAELIDSASFEIEIAGEENLWVASTPSPRKSARGYTMPPFAFSNRAVCAATMSARQKCSKTSGARLKITAHWSRSRRRSSWMPSANAPAVSRCTAATTQTSIALSAPGKSTFAQ
jgi:glycine cleavage system aminomethyltransferase T